MKRCWRAWKAMLFPHRAVFYVLMPLSAGLLIYTFTASGVYAGIKYAAYMLSAYTLVILCCQMPSWLRFCQELGQTNQYVVRYLNDARWRIMLSLYGSVAFNAAYALLQLGLGIYHAAVWYDAMAGYYLLLAVMRLYLLKYTKKHAPGERLKNEWQRYRLCGVSLVAMNLALAVVVFYMTRQNRTFIHHKITVIAMAAYTFTAFTMAIAQLIHSRQNHSPVFSAARVIGFTAALVSMLILEKTMLTAFGGGENVAFDRWMTGATGAAVTLLILVMAIYMIVKSTRELRWQSKPGA